MSSNKKLLFKILGFIGVGGLVFMLYLKYRVAPDLDFSTLQLKTPEGNSVQLDTYRGKVVFINFWQTWCGPCNDEMPSIENARTQLDTAKFIFLVVSDESPGKIKSFSSSHNYHFTYFISQKKFSELGINTYPTTYILNKSGKAIFTKIGGFNWSDPGMIEQLKNMAR